MNTKTISIKEAVPGMIVAQDIYGLQDYLIIPAHSELTNHSITRLKFYAIQSIVIEINEEGNPETMDYGDGMSNTYTEYIRKTPEFSRFEAAFDATTEDLKKHLKILNGKLTKPLDSASLLNDINELLSSSRNGTHVVHLLQGLKNSDDVTYKHSICTAVLCNVIGRWLKYSEKDLETLTLSGLLHDIGKIMIPSAILHKPGPLSAAEYEIVKKHPQDGYELVQNQGLNPHIANSILMHHERMDGSGYPQGLKGNQIDEFSQIVAIADVYIAMINPRVYRRANCPFDAMSVFEQDGLQKFSPKILLTFLEGMAGTYMNSTVRLSDDRVGEIVMIDSTHITHPVVKVGSTFVDLNKERGLHIQDVL